jgi:hypothetical protein
MSEDNRVEFNERMMKLKTNFPDYEKNALKTDLLFLQDYLKNTQSSRTTAEREKMKELAEVILKINNSDDPDVVDKVRDSILGILSVVLHEK